MKVLASDDHSLAAGAVKSPHLLELSGIGRFALDSPLEGGGFEPSVPRSPGRLKPLGLLVQDWAMEHSIGHSKHQGSQLLGRSSWH